jgi:hypothetical protein
MKLGNVVVDKISNFKGVLSGRHEYLNGCVRWSVSPQELHEGKPIETQVFDEEQLEVVDAPKINFLRRLTGGDRPNPPQRSAPSR